MNSFWSKKRVLITGASGFIGSHLTHKLADLQADITALSNKQTNQGKTSMTIGDITDTDFILELFKNNHFEYCFHLAGQALVDKGSTDPTPTFEINIKGTWNILEAARQNKVQGTIIASTSHVYGQNTLPFLEEYFPRPSRPYETSKACADMIAQTYAQYYSLPVAIARCVNIYGPGDQNDRIVPHTIKNLINNKPPEILNDMVTRDYIYIDDVINAYITLAENLPTLEEKNGNIIFNFGTGKHYTNKDIVEKIIKLFGNEHLEPIITKLSRKQEIIKQYVSIEKAQKYFHWQPTYNLEEGLKKTIDWYKKNA